MNDMELYEHIFCTNNTVEERERLVEKYRDRICNLEQEHKKSGIKINGNLVHSFEDMIRPT